MLPGFLGLGWNAQGIIHRARYDQLRCSVASSVEHPLHKRYQSPAAKLEWTPGGYRSAHTSSGGAVSSAARLTCQK